MNAENINALFSFPNTSILFLLNENPELMNTIINPDEWIKKIPLNETSMAILVSLGEKSPPIFSIEIKEALYKRIFDELCTIFDDSKKKK